MIIVKAKIRVYEPELPAAAPERWVVMERINDRPIVMIDVNGTEVGVNYLDLLKAVKVVTQP